MTFEQKNDKLANIQSQNNILDISSGFLHLAGDSLIPETISKKCLEDAKVLHQVDKKFILVVAGRTLAVIDQVCLLHVIAVWLNFFFRCTEAVIEQY